MKNSKEGAPMNATLQVILPERSGDDISEDLRDLTQMICEANPELDGGFGLGGEFGYGANFENKVFAMRKFYWGDCDCEYEDREDAWSSENFHAPECYYVDLQSRKQSAGLSYIDTAKNEFVAVKDSRPYDTSRAIEEKIYKEVCLKYNLPSAGCAIHCTCGHHELWETWAEENGHRPTCSVVLPNFKHKRTGLEIRWYKWIGRDNEFSGTVGNWPEIIAECKASIAPPLSPQCRRLG